MDVERTIQVIVERQAAFVAGMDELREMQRRTDERIDKLISATDEKIDKLISATDERIGKLITASDGQIDKLISATDERIDKLNSATDGRINHLTSVVASLALTAQAHQASLDAFDSKWKDFLSRFDAWLRGQGGNGKS